MEYTPKSPVVQQAAPSYALKKDLTGKPSEIKRGIYSLTDKNGEVVNFPHHPNPKCKPCKGRGYIGTDVKTGRLVICHKCYKKVFKK